MSRNLHIKTAHQLTEQLLWPGFVDYDGVILRGDCRPARTKWPAGTDLTAEEATLNDIALIDCFRHSVKFDTSAESFNSDQPDFKLLCNLGKSMAQMWYRKLQLDYPHYRFRVYFTARDHPKVRFHRVRPDEPPWLDENDWAEEIKQGEVVIYDTEVAGPLSPSPQRRGPGNSSVPTKRPTMTLWTDDREQFGGSQCWWLL